MASLKSDAAIARTWLNDVEPALQQKDGTNVLLVQSLQSFFYLMPYHCVSLYEVYSRAVCGKVTFLGGGKEGGAAWSSLVLGAYLQSSFVQCYMTMAEYQGPGEITYVKHDPTILVNGAVIAGALYQQQLQRW